MESITLEKMGVENIHPLFKHKTFNEREFGIKLYEDKENGKGKR